jgi:hypothetical protein
MHVERRHPHVGLHRGLLKLASGAYRPRTLALCCTRSPRCPVLGNELILTFITELNLPDPVLTLEKYCFNNPF